MFCQADAGKLAAPSSQSSINFHHHSFDILCSVLQTTNKMKLIKQNTNGITTIRQWQYYNFQKYILFMV